MTSIKFPVVLCLSGHDPGGGAGVQADIETVAALGGHAVTVITAGTVQDTDNVSRTLAVDSQLIREQLDVLLADSQIDAVKIGLIGDAAQVDLLVRVVDRLRVPVVLDPVLRAGGGAELATKALIERMRQDLVPRATVLTPNAAEAGRLASAGNTLDERGAALVALGARNVLITGGDEAGDPVVNHWFSGEHSPRRFAWPRLAGTFHGAGCTLAAAIAALLGAGLPMDQALTDAQAYTHRALARAVATGRGRRIPGRAGP